VSRGRAPLFAPNATSLILLRIASDH
jgi:hypothetical protein